MLVSLRLCRFILPLAVLCAFFAPGALAADAPRPGAVGDSGHLWLVAPAPAAGEGWQALYRHPGQAGTVALVPGGIAVPAALPDGAPAICAHAGTLYVAGLRPGGGLQVEELQVSEPTQSQQGLSLTRRMLAVLSPAAKLLAMTADRQKVWLAVEAAPADVFTAMRVETDIDAAGNGTPKALPLDLALGLPPGTVGQVSGEAPSPAVVGAPIQLSVERKLLLLRVEGGKLVLARPFDAAPKAWLASDGKRMLFSRSIGRVWLGDPAALHPLEGLGGFTDALFVGSQPVLANLSLEHVLGESAWSDILRVKWSVLRESRAPAGECSLPLGTGEGYGLVEWEGHAALARVSAGFKPGQLAATLLPVDLRGGVLPAVELLQTGVPKTDRGQVFWLLAGSVVVAFVLMGWTWRRGPRLLPHLPTHLRRAGLLRRAGALLIDLSLAVVPVAMVAGVPVVEILRNWPNLGDPSDLSDMRLGFVSVGVFILHTLLGEWLFGRSAGKVMMGIGVVGLDGKRAPFWRILLRGLLKWIELLNPMLAIIAVFSPFGQRLGDLVAGTVVVSIRKPGEP